MDNADIKLEEEMQAEIRCFQAAKFIEDIQMLTSADASGNGQRSDWRVDHRESLGGRSQRPRICQLRGFY